MSEEQEGLDPNSEEIINLAINVFQNVGIKRWIDHIEILKNEQIYIDICKIIFPETTIETIRINEHPYLTTSQKIQAIINLIAKQIKNDLYHISGEAIFRGDPGHLKHFLQLLEALSSPMIRGGRIEVESAPENDQSMDDQENRIDKEFKKMFFEEEEESASEPSLNRQPLPQKPSQKHNRPQNSGGSEVSQRSGTQKDFLKPKKEGRPSQQNQNRVQNMSNQQKPIKKIKKNKNAVAPPRPTKTPTPLSHPTRIPYPSRQISDADYENHITNGRWLDLVRRINQTKEGLEKERMKRIKAQFLAEQRQAKARHSSELRVIEQQIKERKKYLNQKMGEREQMLQALKGEKQAKQAIKDLFRQEKKVKRQQKRKMLQRQQQEINKIMNFDYISELFQVAIKSNQRSNPKE